MSVTKFIPSKGSYVNISRVLIYNQRTALL